MRSSLALCLGSFALSVVLGACAARDDVGGPQPPPAATAAAPAEPAVERPIAETCNALDDDGDGKADEGAVCAAACSSDALAKATASIRLPHDGDITVPTDSSETPELLAITTVPAVCLGAMPASTAQDVTVRCGEVLVVDATGLTASTLRVAPGGVVRIGASATLAIHDEILVCPGATIEAGADIALAGDGKAGANLDLRAERLIMLGSIGTHGGFVPEHGPGQPGAGGRLDIEVERLLFSGLIETAEDPPRHYRAGAPGAVTIHATKESFFAGKVRSGDARIDIPVCCH